MRRILIAIAATALVAGTAVAQTAVTTTTETFVTAKPTDVLSNNLIGLNVTNQVNETIGEIKDLILSQGDLSGYIVSVGGFLGLGERYVIVRPSAVKVSYAENDNKWHAVMNATKDQLKSAPEFKYEGRWKR
jgi:PRC-barrel domain